MKEITLPHIYIYTHTHTHTHTYIYIYIYWERDRERERVIHTRKDTIYIYIYIPVCWAFFISTVSCFMSLPFLSEAKIASHKKNGAQHLFSSFYLTSIVFSLSSYFNLHPFLSFPYPLPQVFFFSFSIVTDSHTSTTVTRISAIFLPLDVFHQGDILLYTIFPLIWVEYLFTMPRKLDIFRWVLFYYTLYA